MDSTSLKLRAQEIFQKKWLPGRDQEQIQQGVEELERIIEELHTREHPAAQTVLLETQHLYDKTQRILAHGVYEVNKPGMERLTDNLQRIIATYASPITHNRFIIRHDTLSAQKNLSSVQAPVRSFTHIPFSYVEASQQDTKDVRKALHANSLPIIPETRYHVHPAKSQKILPNLKLIGAPEAWKSATGNGVDVAVMDTGCDYMHKEIASRFGQTIGYDFVNETNNPMDDNGHGTHVAGTIGGVDVGVAPGVNLYALKMLDHNGSGYGTDFLRACDWAIDNDIQIVNASFGGRNTNEAEKRMLDIMYEKNILFVAAAGNNGTNEYSYPASHEHAISVAAVNYDKTRASFSQYNDQINISAPGVGVQSCLPGGGYGAFDGTSMASPHSGGSFALLLELHSNVQEVRERIYSHAEPLGKKIEYGHGLIRPDKAINQN